MPRLLIQKSKTTELPGAETMSLVSAANSEVLPDQVKIKNRVEYFIIFLLIHMHQNTVVEDVSEFQ
jgi:hypothetical protein